MKVLPLIAKSYLTLTAIGLLWLSTALADSGNQKILKFQDAKKLALKIHSAHPVTIYCPCSYSGKIVDLKSCNYKVYKNAARASRLEWEHVVPAEAFGQSFKEWREGAENCRKKNGKVFKGRKCAEKNSLFNLMEADLYNLWPVIGELNGLRSNYSMAEISVNALTFGGCKAKIAERKFEPMDQDKGIVARSYLYMEGSYPGHGIISEKNKKLFNAWDISHPVTDWECHRGMLIKELQGNSNPILENRCKVPQ